MNMKDYKVEKNKFSVKVLVGKEWFNLINLLFTDAAYRALTSLEHYYISLWQSVLFCNVVALKTCIY